MKTLQEKIAVMQAAADGKPIEYRVAPYVGLPQGGNWVRIYEGESATWDWKNFDFRVAEDMELKAFNMHGAGSFPEVRHITPGPYFRAWMRNIINAVKAGEIT
jgi:hypothetical protein